MRSLEKPYDLSAVRISLASPEDIRAFSYGEVTNSRSINYKTMSPEKGGIFCEVIFGPLKDYECSCGALQGMEYEGRVCQSCGVEVNSSRVRRYRMGHIELSSPIPHLWFFKVRPYYLSTFLGMKLKDLEKILSCPREILFHVHQKKLPGKRPYHFSPLRKFAGTGHEVLHSYLKSFDLVQEYFYQRHALFNTFSESQTLPGKYNGFMQSYIFSLELKRFKLIQWFLANERRPEWMMFSVLPVLPPELRPFLVMPNNLIISSDLNLLYKKILDRNRRLRSLKQLSQEYSSTVVTSSFVYNELNMLQHSIDCLIENGRRGKPLLNKRKLPLKSLAHILKGKEGRFRMNLLGKRVDLSGRTVISVGPRLKMTQCGLPLFLAVNLFQSFLYKKMSSLFLRKSFQYKTQKKTPKWKPENLLQMGYQWSNEMLQQMEEIIYAHPVLLNRAPTLHRLNVQAFQPILINNKAIQLHPLVCSSFNADFDGDQMAVHVPLSLSSQIESRMLMMTYNNIISPSNGSVLIMPSQDVIFGLYYASLLVPSSHPLRFTKMEELQLVLLEKKISLHTQIYFFLQGAWVLTTAGRVFLYSLLGPSSPLPFSSFNSVLTKKKIHDLLRQAHDHLLREDFLYFLDQVMAYGFYYAHQAGVSMSLNDVIVPSFKKRIVAEATEKSTQAVLEYEFGSLNHQEKMNKVIREWSQSQEFITASLLKDVFESSKDEMPPIYMLIYSGARGSILQMRQLSGLRGLMVKPSGETIEMPIASNFKEGLKVLEYFHSTHGARKGVIDTSIRTATSGYLTRRLVHASQGILITEEDCGTSLGMEVRTEYQEGKEIVSLSSQAVGRVLARDVIDFNNGQVLFPRNTFMDPKAVEKLVSKKVEAVFVRTPLTCQSNSGLCQMCYGSHLTSGKKVLLGEPVGILASQSIGEPGTQLTMRTFHMGGVLQGTSEASKIYSKEKGRIFFKNLVIIPLKHKINTSLCVSRHAEFYLIGSEDQILARYEVPYGSMLFVQEGEVVSKQKLLFQWNPFYEPVLHTSTEPSYVICKDFVKNITYTPMIQNSQEIRKILPPNDSMDEFFPRLVLVDENANVRKVEFFHGGKKQSFSQVYYLQEDDLCMVHSQQKVHLGEILYLIPRQSSSTVDITGGLSKISQFFESSFPFIKEKILTSEEGFYFVYPSRMASRVKWKITQTHPERTMIFPLESKLKIRHFTHFLKGENLSMGFPSFEELLELHGSGKAILQFKENIQAIYRANGVTIHDKHLELILNRMYARCQVVDAGQTSFVLNEEIYRESLIEQNLLHLAKGLKPAKSKVLVRGVTSISLESSSFLSAAAFQNTSLVLSRSAVQGRMDHLRGLSENVILGRLCPVGTGAMLSTS